MHHMFTASFRVLVVGGGLFTAVVCSSPAQADGATLNGQPTQGRISGVALDADDSPLADHTIELNVILDQGMQKYHDEPKQYKGYLKSALTYRYRKENRCITCSRRRSEFWSLVVGCSRRSSARRLRKRTEQP